MSFRWTHRLTRASLLKRIPRDRLEHILLLAKEYCRRQAHPSRSYVPDEDEKRPQKQFHSSKAAVRIAEGGNQSGKSFAGAHEIRMWMEGTHPWIKTPEDPPQVYVISTEYRTLQEGIWRNLKEILPDWKIHRRGPKVPNYDIPSFVDVKHPKGISRCHFISGQGSEAARRKVQAAAVHLVVLDEEVDEAMWEELQARRLRFGGKVIITATPYRSDPWLLALEDRAITNPDEVSLYRFHTERAVACGHISREVYEEMEATMSEEEKAVRLRGESRRSQGLIYPEFARQHVVKPFDIPANWARYMAIDPGYRTCAVLWAAVDPSGNAYIYRELYLHGTTHYELSRSIYGAEGWGYRPDQDLYYPTDASEQMDIRWVDPSAFGHHETGEPKIGHLLAGYGLSCAPARNDVEYGIELTRRALMPMVDGTPRLRVFSSLKNFFEEIRSYRRQKDSRDSQKHSRSEAPIKRKDHLMDCMRYLVAGGLEPRRETPEWMLRERAIDHGQIAPLAGASLKMDDAYEEHWRKIMERQRRRARWGSGSSYGLGRER